MAADVMVRLAELTPQDDLHAALHGFLETGSAALPVCEDGAVAGMVTQDDVTMAYEREVAGRLRGDGAE